MGVAIGSFNSKPIFIPEDFYEDAKELLSELVSEDEFEPLEQNEEPTAVESLIGTVYDFFFKKKS